MMNFRASRIHQPNYSKLSKGRDVAQAVSRQIPTAAARVRALGQIMWDLWWTLRNWGKFSPST
jgi:hypothetical protein